jgi:hypothetical protein
VEDELQSVQAVYGDCSVLQVEGLLAMDLVVLTEGQGLEQEGFAVAGFFLDGEGWKFLYGAVGDEEGGPIVLSVFLSEEFDVGLFFLVAGQDGGHHPLSVGGKFAVAFKLYPFGSADHVQLFAGVEVEGEFEPFLEDCAGFDSYGLEVGGFLSYQRYLVYGLF